MTDPRFSIVIPYRRRLDNIRAVFEALSEQTVGRDRFEVVVGAIEHSPEFARACQEFEDRLTVVTVTTGGPWNVCRARNQALRQVSGEIVVLLDADIVLPNGLLERLDADYFAGGREVCVLGRTAGYDDALTDTDVQTVEALAYSHYREVVAGLEAAGGVVPDARAAMKDPAVLWTLVWTGLVAVPTSAVRGDSLLFDEGFQGWGLEDQEWGYRLHATGLPIVLGDRVYGLHLPHVRDLSENRTSDRANSRHFVRKWPTPDVELLCAFGWNEANLLHAAATEDLAAATGPAGARLGVVRGSSDGRETLVVGVVLDDAGEPVGADAAHAGGPGREVLPLVGFALPFTDQSVATCRVLPPISRLGDRFRDAVLTEAHRVASSVTVL